MARSPVRGDGQLLRNLERIQRSASAREIDEAIRLALEPLRNETRNRAPRASLKRGVVTRKVRQNSRTNREFWVSFRRGIAMRIAHLIEFGTAPHSLAKGASRRKNYLQDVPPFHPGTRPFPFMRPAYDATHEEVFATAGERLWALIIRSLGQ